MSVLFWITVALLAYSYVGYGLLLIALGLVWHRRVSAPPREPLSVTLLIAAHNEAGHIGRKLENALSLETGGHMLDIVVVSDGSTDQTPQEVRMFEDRGVRLIEIKDHVGKIAALNRALPELKVDVVVFSDANSVFQPQTMVSLLEHFGDPAVGGVCGWLTVPQHKRSWLGQGEALYWTYDHALKLAESRLSGAIMGQGSLYAVRRELLSPLPPAVSDDITFSLRVVAQGKRFVMEPKAVTEEQVSGDTGREFGRRVRSTERAMRGLFHTAEVLNPFRYGFYSIQLISHKVLRTLAPFFLIVLALANLMLLTEHPIYAVTASLQAGWYGMAALAWLLPSARRMPCFSIPLFFVVGHAALGLGLVNLLRGQRTDRWRPWRDI